MKIHLARGGKIASIAFLAMLLCNPAFALDGDALAERLKQLAERQDLSLSFESAETSGSNVTLKNTVIGAEGQDNDIQVGDVALNDVVENDDGSYVIGEVDLPDYAFTDRQFTLSFTGLRANGLHVPADDATGPLSRVTVYDRIGVDSVVMKDGDAEIVNLQNFSANMSVPDDDKSKLTFSGGVEKLQVNLSEMKGPNAEKSREMMNKLGYETLEMSIDVNGYWTPADGHLVLRTEKISMKDAASLDLSLDLGGYTPEFLASIRQISQEMSGGTPEQKSAQGLALMGLMQQLIFNSASIRIEDSSLTNRILDYVADQQGVKRADVINQAKGVIPFMLARLGNKDFAQQVTEAVSAYLDDPKNIEVSAKPSDPLPFAIVMATGMTAPQSLPEKLGVTVTANQ